MSVKYDTKICLVIPGGQQNCFSWQKKKLHEIFKTELHLFRFVLLTLLTAGIHFKFKRFGFCNRLLIKWFSRWNMT
jgi:hypothetical protein